MQHTWRTLESIISRWAVSAWKASVFRSQCHVLRITGAKFVVCFSCFAELLGG